MNSVLYNLVFLYSIYDTLFFKSFSCKTNFAHELSFVSGNYAVCIYLRLEFYFLLQSYIIFTVLVVAALFMNSVGVMGVLPYIRTGDFGEGTCALGKKIIASPCPAWRKCMRHEFLMTTQNYHSFHSINMYSYIIFYTIYKTDSLHISVVVNSFTWATGPIRINYNYFHRFWHPEKKNN